jgi:hypothetical protein
LLLRCRRGFGTRQAEEGSGFRDDIGEVDEAAALANYVEQIAMLAGGGVLLMCNCT